MAVRIRLKKFGTKNRIQWRIVVVDSRSPRDGRFIEEIGFYDPLPIEEKFRIKRERLDFWVQNGAQVTPTIKSLIKRADKKVKNSQAS